MTDANVVLGRLRPEYFMGGRMALAVDRSEGALAALGRQMGGLDSIQAAGEVLRLVLASMEDAIRVISVERGHDPRDFTLVGFGGAGGLHVFDLAGALEMKRVLIPCHPGVLSALGAVAMPVRMETSRTLMMAWMSDRFPEVRNLLDGMADDVRQRFARDGLSTGTLQVTAQVDMRYTGQSFELSVPVDDMDPGAVSTRFHALHAQRYGHAEPTAPLELVTVRLQVTEPAPELQLPPLPVRRAGDPEPLLTVIPNLGSVFQRGALRQGDRIRGPALIVEDYSTHWIPEGWSIDVDVVGNLLGTKS